MLSFEGGTLLYRETVTPLRRDVIHRELAWFWCIIHVCVSVIIPVLKKKALLFDSPSYSSISRSLSYDYEVFPLFNYEQATHM